MSESHSTTAQITSWDEDRSLTELPRVTPAKVQVSLPDVNGKLTSHYLITYHLDGNSTFVMVDEVEMELNGKKGTFMMEGHGKFNKATLEGDAELQLVPDTLRGELTIDSGISARLATTSKPGTFSYTFQIK